MRDRLIELLMGSEAFNGADGKADAKHIADYLLANGVIVPPCKVGDMAYFILEDEEEGEKYIESQRINDVSTRGLFVSTSIVEENSNEFEPYSELGKTVFLTREEAEQALKGGEG